MNRRRLVVYAVSALSISHFASCSGGSDPPENIEISHVPINDLGPIAKNVYIFRSQEEWSNFWALHPHWLTPKPTIPVVDFTKFAVAGVCEGSKGICQRLEIISGILDNGVATFTYRIVKWGASTPSSCIGGDRFVLNLADFVLVRQSAREVVMQPDSSPLMPAP
jgi:hypothetical protein